MKYRRNLLATLATVALLLPLFIFTAAPTGGGGGGGTSLATKVTTVTEAAAAATCDFSQGYICQVVRTGNPTITITLTNIPTNQYVTVLQNSKTNSTNLSGTTWSLSGGTVFCPASNNLAVGGDQAAACAAGQNGFNQTQSIYSVHMWSDGTNVWVDGAGMFETLNGAHGNFVGMSDGASGLAQNNNGHLTWNSATSGVGSLALSTCGSAPSPTLQSFSTDNVFAFTGGGGATACTVTFNTSFGRAPAFACSDQTRAAALQVAPAANGNTVTISGFTALDTISCLSAGL